MKKQFNSWVWMVLPVVVVGLLMVSLSQIGCRRRPSFIEDNDDAVRVPRLKGRRLDVVRDILDDRGLRVGRISRVKTGHHPRGTVIRQSPRSGRYVPPGSRVDLRVEARRPDHQVIVPGVVGMDRKRAIKRIRKADLRVEVKPIVGPGKPGTVLRQRPRAGQKIPPGATVVLLVKEKSQRVIVPNVVGLRPKTAISRLKKVHLQVETRIKKLGKGKRRRVLSQRPRPGIAVPRGTVVHLFIGAGKP